MIRVVIADDHELFSDGLSAVLSSTHDIDVVAQVGSGTDAFSAALELVPDILLLDVEMPGLPTISVIQRLAIDAPSVRALVVTMHRDRTLASQMTSAGAFGFLSKASSSSQLIEALRHVKNNPRPPAMRQAQNRILSSREREVLRLVANGHSNAEIARELSVVVGTVKRHNSKIFAKLGAKSRTDAVRRAYRIGELGDDQLRKEP